MRVSHLTTKTATFEGTEIQEAFKALVNTGHPFSIWIDAIGFKFPVPFTHGVSTNAKVEKCVQELIKREFGEEVHFS